MSLQQQLCTLLFPAMTGDKTRVVSISTNFQHRFCDACMYLIAGSKAQLKHPADAACTHNVMLAG
jgi:RNase P subunit RPR2